MEESYEAPKSTYKKPEEEEKKKANSGSNTLLRITFSPGGIALGLISLIFFKILAYE